MDYTPTPRPTVVAVAASSTWKPMPKREYVRSEALLALIRTQILPCQHCGARDGTIVAAHSNWSVHGKGKGIKADDNRIAALCFACHSQLDQGSAWSEDQRKAMWWPAHCSTVSSLVRLGAWPAGAPIPDIADCPWELLAA